ncbi:hypothetical protein FACS189432_02810 [Bacteroidia bacterium]|nr:hypothetical protein FACS189432_02810 [Bacteroidia bacterium]GHV71127.1 hypothetical protein FACS189420_5040 [Bacteroidia bacterium]
MATKEIDKKKLAQDAEELLKNSESSSVSGGVGTEEESKDEPSTGCTSCKLTCTQEVI